MPKGQPGTKAPHGTITRYTAHSCRCRLCKDAVRDYDRAKHNRRPAEVVNAERAAKHGTETRAKRCDCAECRKAANTARQRRRRENGPGPLAAHGLHSTYGSGCRCDQCRQATAEYHRRRRATKRQAHVA